VHCGEQISALTVYSLISHGDCNQPRNQPFTASTSTKSKPSNRSKHHEEMGCVRFMRDAFEFRHAVINGRTQPVGRPLAAG
jgi:hypothetical protein